MTAGRKGRRLSKDERALWDGVTRSVAPLQRRSSKQDRDIEEQSEAAPKAAVRPASRLKVSAPPSKSMRVPALAPLERRLKQRLGRGREDVDARIDLHGDTQAEAHDRLRRFLRSSQDKGATLVLVITGKGARPGSGREGVLKRQVPLWLALPELRDYVVGFDIASATHGGEGALYVRIRKRRTAGR